MTSPTASAQDSGWTLHVDVDLEYAGTLIYEPDGATLLEVPLRASWTSLVLALAVSHEVDLRKGRRTKVGCRSLPSLGHMLRIMPGTGHPVEASAIASYKAQILRQVRTATESLSREQRPPFVVPAPVLHPGYHDGYCTVDGGIDVAGIDFDALVRRASV